MHFCEAQTLFRPHVIKGSRPTRLHDLNTVDTLDTFGMKILQTKSHFITLERYVTLRKVCQTKKGLSH